MSYSREIPIETLGIPKNTEWGPLLWQMLHGCAEKLGRAPNTLIFQDHRREMIFILRYTELIMPCQMCRNHYKEWRTKHPIDQFPDTQNEFREAVRKWLYDLHEEVNQSHSKAGLIKIEDLPKKYGGFDLKDVGQRFFQLMDRALRLKAVGREELKKFNTHYTFLSRIL